jgi:flagellar hook-associated protein 2
VDTLARVGVTTERDGTLSVDATRFQSVVGDDPEALRTLVAGTSSTDGIADRLVTFLTDATKTVSGAIAARRDGIDSSIRSIQRQIDAAEKRIEASERLLRARFTTLEQVMAEIQSTGTALLTQLQTLSRQLTSS